MNNVKIGSSYVGKGNPIYAIAEIGINHNGDMDTVMQLIDNSKAAGFNAVKFQKRTVEIVYSKSELLQERESVFGKTNGDLKRGLELSKENYSTIDKYCKNIGIDWFASPWDEESVDFLENFDVVAHKIASACLTNAELLQRLNRTKKPIILSTGMSSLDQVKKALSYLADCQVILMHAVSVYPAKDSALNLSAISTLQKEFPDLPVGYSGHEVGVLPTVIAVAKYDAACIERHITLDRSMWGSDQSASLELPGMVKLIRDIREIPKLLGHGQVIVEEFEVPVLNKLRRVDNI